MTESWDLSCKRVKVEPGGSNVQEKSSDILECGCFSTAAPAEDLIYFLLFGAENTCPAIIRHPSVNEWKAVTSCCCLWTLQHQSRLETHPTPVERPGEVISCSQRKHGHRRLRTHLQLIQSRQDPPHLRRDGSCRKTSTNESGMKPSGQSYGAVAAAGQDPQIWHFAIQLQPERTKRREQKGAWLFNPPSSIQSYSRLSQASLGQVEDLSGVQDPHEHLQELGALRWTQTRRASLRVTGMLGNVVRLAVMKTSWWGAG